MGSVWLALDSQLRRRVAVKMMTSEHVDSPRARRDFEREAQGVARLSSPHIVQVYDYGMDGDVPFLVMELLEGEDLETRLSRRPRLTPRVVAGLLAQAAKALDLAHGLGVVHRDLKPANVFLARTPAGEVLKLLDFGVAAWRGALDAGRDAEGAGASSSPYLVGTVAYLSPEQAWQEHAPDPRSDLWSLAVIAYRALTGSLPFPARTAGELMVRIHGGEAVPPSRVVPELGDGADAFFARALAHDPERRFPSAPAMAAAFVELVEKGVLPSLAKILVVDDEPDVFALMTQHFRDADRRPTHELVFAADGLQALEQLKDHPDIDLALADLSMPRLDGFGFLQRAPAINPLLKTVVVSAYGDMTNVRRAMNRGAFDFLVKPIDLDDLDATVEKGLQEAREKRRARESLEENEILRMVVGGGADRILPAMKAAGTPPAERVPATIVFVGVAGWSAAAAALRPEEAVGALTAHLDVLVSEVLARGGHVDKLLGPALLLVFRGDDHLRRAVLACVAARRRLHDLASRGGMAFAGSLSAGLDSGEVVASSIHSVTLSRLDDTVLGRVVGTAARLHMRARPGQILVTDEVRSLVEPFFVIEEAPAMTEPEGPPRAFTVVAEAAEA
jgi:CheY-like chemotaxis protein/tRNA A-37 threonylcarbamoyl transferase component Bud32